MTRDKNRCPGCFQKKNDAPLCPACGYDESERRSPLILPHWTRLDNDHYTVGKILGAGKFGITYLGYDLRLKGFVAIKEFLPRDLAGRDSTQAEVFPHTGEDRASFAEGLEKFMKEAQTLYGLKHPNIVRVLNFFQENQTAYMVMEYYRGLTLEAYRLSQGGTLPETLAVNIAMPILDGLRKVHETRLDGEICLHRDIKPANVYLTEDNRPILLDFGAARFAAVEKSRSYTMILTPGFAPYEQHLERSRQGPWTDVYACGATLYTLLTGKIPVASIERKERKETQGTDPLPPAETLVPHVSPSVAKALSAALAIEPMDRPQTSMEFQKLLTFIPVDLPQSQKPPSPSTGGRQAPGEDGAEPAAPRPAADPTPPKSPASPQNPKPKRGKAVAVFCLLALLLAGALYAFKDSLFRLEPETFAFAVQAVPEDARVEIVAPQPLPYAPGMKLPPGLYQVRASRRGFETQTQWAEIADRSLLLKIELAPLLYSVAFAVEPPDATVRFIEPEMDFANPAKLPAGRYRIQTSSEPWFETKKEWIEVGYQDQHVEVALERAETVVNRIEGVKGAASAEMTFKLISPGKSKFPSSFIMGSPETEDGRYGDETPHKVSMTKSYYIQTTEVTHRQWKAVTGSLPEKLRFKDCGENCPVERVSWLDAKEFIRLLNKMENTDKYRLPTEIEWEYACRAGTDTAIYTGDMKIEGDRDAPALDAIAWYGGNSCVAYSDGYDCSDWKNTQYSCSKCGPHPVGRKAPNAWGLYDMLGNVWEWCEDWKGDYPKGNVTDAYIGKSGSYRVNRGGGWFTYARSCRSAFRVINSPGSRGYNLGFRLARTP